MNNYKEILAGLSSLVVFSGLRTRPLIAALEKVLLGIIKINEAEAPELSDILELAESRGALLMEMAVNYPNLSFSDAVAREALTDDDIFTLSCERGCFADGIESGFDGGIEDPPLIRLVRADFVVLSKLIDFDIAGLFLSVTMILNKVRYGSSGCRGVLRQRAKPLLPESGDNTLACIIKNADLKEFSAYLRKHGAGIFAKHNFFYWEPGLTGKSPQMASRAPGQTDGPAENAFVPAQNPDKIKLSELCGYESQQQVIIDNTKRFIRGNGANNILLYGDRGTGKSATVKAVCNEYTNEGVRLIEISKGFLKEIPSLLPVLAKRGLYFILFIDDLSFEKQDDSFNALKAVIEGGIEAKPKNVVIYATSNRRHLVKERINDRPTALAVAEGKESGDMRAFDTMQEQFSLADRFGLTVIFTAPSQDEYLKIVDFLAKKEGITDKNLLENALKWERWFNGRSPRTAKQYIDWISGAVAESRSFPWE